MFGNPLKDHLLLMADLPGGGGGGNPQEWFTGLPDTLKPDAAVFEPFKDKPVTDVLGAYRDLSKKAADYTMPASVKEYGLKIPKVPDGVTIDEKALESFVGQAFAAGVPPKALQAMVDKQFEETAAAHEEGKKLAEKADRALRDKWGEKYNENIALTTREIKALPKDMQDIIEKAGLGSHPHLLELIHLVASAKREGRLLAGGDEGAGRLPASEVFYGKPAGA